MNFIYERIFQPSMGPHVHHSSTQAGRAGGFQIEASLGYVARYYLNNQNQTNKDMKEDIRAEETAQSVKC